MHLHQVKNDVLMPGTVVHNVHLRAGEGFRRCDANPSHSATVIHHNSITLCHIIQFISLDSLAGINWIIIQFVPAKRTLSLIPSSAGQ